MHQHQYRQRYRHTHKHTVSVAPPAAGSTEILCTSPTLLTAVTLLLVLNLMPCDVRIFWNSSLQKQQHKQQKQQTRCVLVSTRR